MSTGAVTWDPVRRSPAHRMHADLGASFERIGGWEIPAAYRDRARESAWLARGVGVCDVTARGKIDVQGEVDKVLAAAGNAIVVARISEVWALLLTEPGESERRAPELETAAGAAAMVTDATDLYAGFALAGPMVPDLLARVTPFDPDALGAGEAVGTTFAEIRGVLVRRDLPGEPVEAYVTSDHGRYAFETLLVVAEGLGGGAVGWTALREEGWRPC